MFGRRRKSEQRSGVECPLCHLMNNEDAQACSRCYYDFSKPSHQQVQPLENSESEGLLDLLVAEVDLNEEQEDLVDWTGHTFEMEDVTIDIHQYDDSGTVAISESPSFARQFVDTSSIGGKEDDLELEASDAPTDVERFVVPTEEIEDWNETLEHRVRLVDPTTGESAVDIDADLNESNWEASTGGTASAPNIEPQENLVTSTQTSLQDIQVASDSAAGNDAASLPPLPNGATAPIASPVRPGPGQATYRRACRSHLPSARCSTIDSGHSCHSGPSSTRTISRDAPTTFPTRCGCSGTAVRNPRPNLNPSRSGPSRRRVPSRSANRGPAPSNSAPPTYDGTQHAGSE